MQQPLEANRDLIVNVNGQLVHRNEAAVSPFDSAVQAGDAVWEMLRIYDGRIYKLYDHLERMRCSAQALAFDDIPPHDEIIRQVVRTLEANGMRDGAVVRVTLSRGVKLASGLDPRLNTRGHTLIVLAEHLPPAGDSSGLTLVTSSVRRPAPDVLDAKIHHTNLLNSILAKLEANAAGADEGLLLDSRGYVAETTASHLFIVEEEIVSTSRAIACPEGITRAAVFELCGRHGLKAMQRDLTLAEIYRADEVFTSGTLSELAAVVRLDGRTIGNGQAGPITERLRSLFAEAARREGVPVV